jgi:uncharacterized RDD family membrane protein YckC
VDDDQHTGDQIDEPLLAPVSADQDNERATTAQDPGEPPRPGARVSASLLDAVIAFLLVSALQLILFAVVVHPKAGAKLTPSQTRLEFWLYLTSLAAAAVLFATLHRMTGRSVGKRVMRFHLADADGQRPTFARLLLKYAVMFALCLPTIGILIVLIAVVLPVTQAQRRTIFDQVSGLYPVRDVSDGGAAAQPD